MGCLDLGGFFDGYGFDVNSGAAEKVYYGETFDVFESVGQEDVCFFAIVFSIVFLKRIIAFFMFSYNVLKSTRFLESDLQVRGLDMFLHLRSLSALF